MRALVVDDNDAFRTLVVALLGDVADVVEQAADGQVAVQLARDLRPDLVVMDITMPRMDGISAARAILDVYPSVRFVFLSGTETAKSLRRRRDPYLQRLPRSTLTFLCAVALLASEGWCSPGASTRSHNACTSALRKRDCFP